MLGMAKIVDVEDIEVEEAERLADTEGTQLMYATEGPESSLINVPRERDEGISFTSNEVPDSPPPAYEDPRSSRGSGASSSDI